MEKLLIKSSQYQSLASHTYIHPYVCTRVQHTHTHTHTHMRETETERERGERERESRERERERERENKESERERENQRLAMTSYQAKSALFSKFQSSKLT